MNWQNAFRVQCPASAKAIVRIDAMQRLFGVKPGMPGNRCSENTSGLMKIAAYWQLRAVKRRDELMR